MQSIPRPQGRALWVRSAAYRLKSGESWDGILSPSYLSRSARSVCSKQRRVLVLQGKGNPLKTALSQIAPVDNNGYLSLIHIKLVKPHAQSLFTPWSDTGQTVIEKWEPNSECTHRLELRRLKASALCRAAIGSKNFVALSAKI
jgi:hypothetical protein